MFGRPAGSRGFKLARLASAQNTVSTMEVMQIRSSTACTLTTASGASGSLPPPSASAGAVANGCLVCWCFVRKQVNSNAFKAAGRLRSGGQLKNTTNSLALAFWLNGWLAHWLAHSLTGQLSRRLLNLSRLQSYCRHYNHCWRPCAGERFFVSQPLALGLLFSSKPIISFRRFSSSRALARSLTLYSPFTCCCYLVSFKTFTSRLPV